MRLAALVALGWLMSACSPPAAVHIDDPYIHPPVPGRDVAVGYFDLRNDTATDIALAAATSPNARAIEIHTHIRDGEMLRMRRLETVAVASGSLVEFAPGGHHLMLFGYSGPEHGSITITLQFSSGEPRSVEFAVQPRGDDR